MSETRRNRTFPSSPQNSRFGPLSDPAGPSASRRILSAVRVVTDLAMGPLDAAPLVSSKVRCIPLLVLDRPPNDLLKSFTSFREREKAAAKALVEEDRDRPADAIAEEH